MFVKYKLILVVVLFECLLCFSSYLFSIRSDIVPWGNSLRDGLYFLAFYVCILPAMLVLSFIKITLCDRRNVYVKYSYLLYSILIFGVSLGDAYSQLNINGGMFLSLFLTIIVVAEVKYIL